MLLLNHLMFRQFRKSAESRLHKRLPVSCGSLLLVQPLTVAQGRARSTLLASLPRERRPQCRRPKRRNRLDHLSFNSWLKCRNWHRTVPSLTARSPPSLLRTRLNTKFHVLSIFSANMSFFRFVCPTLFYKKLMLRHLSLMCRIQCRILFWSKSPL